MADFYKNIEKSDRTYQFLRIKKVPLSVGGEALKCWSDYLLLFECLDDNCSQIQSQQINENYSQ